MRLARWQELWGSASGPVTRLTPAARITCGGFMVALCLLAPALRWHGIAVTLVAACAWLFACRPPARVLYTSSLLAMLLFLPYFLLAPITYWTAPLAPSWASALSAPWVIVLRGTSTMLVSLATAATLTPGALHQGLARLPLPTLISAIVIQVLHQAGALIDETGRINAAIAVRGGGRGLRAALALLRSLPRVWLPRVLERAERVAAAMELRGYCQHEACRDTGSGEGLRDFAALAAALSTLFIALALRLLEVS